MSEFLGWTAGRGGDRGRERSGPAVARGLAREGARVVLGDIDTAGLERTAAELGGRSAGSGSTSPGATISPRSSCCDEAFGPVEVLVTCACIISSAPLAAMTEEERDRVPRHQHEGNLLLHPGGGHADGPAEARPHRHHRLGQCARGGGGSRSRPTCVERRGRCADPQHRPRSARHRRQRQLRQPRPHRLADARAAHPEQRGASGQHPLGWMAGPEEIANGVLFLASSRAASFMYGTNLTLTAVPRWVRPDDARQAGLSWQA